MKTSRLIKALEKAGLRVENVKRSFYDHFTSDYKESRNEYFCKNDKNKVHWYDQDGSAICVQIMGIKQNNDSQSDYFPGYFCKSIKQVVNGMDY